MLVSTEAMVQEIVARIATNITVDTLKYGNAQNSAQFQFNQLVKSGMPAEVANVIIEMALT